MTRQTLPTVIALGGAAANFLDSYTSEVASNRIYLNNDPEAFTGRRGSMCIGLDTQITTGSVSLSLENRDKLRRELAGASEIVVIVGLGGACSNYLDRFAELLGHKLLNTLFFAFVPFDFESRRRSVAKAFLKASSLPISTLDLQVLLEGGAEEESLADFFVRANRVTGAIVECFLASRLEHDV